MRWIAFVPALCGALTAAAAEVRLQPLEPRVVMPDGSAFQSWGDETRYSRTYQVNGNHPRASDQNPGTKALPFKTINHAAQVVKAGERVLIHAGVYRELVRPRSGGEGPDRMIAYEAAPGEEAIIKGSRILEGRWERSADPHRTDPPGDGPHSLIFSKKLWMTALPDSLFENGYLAFQTPNVNDEDFDLMNWAVRWKGRIPYTLPRGLLFQEGRRMVQLATYEDLVRLPGSYWVAPGGKAVHVHPFDGADPNGKLFEAAVQAHIFAPERPGLGFIRVTGLIFEQCANGLPRVGVGALTTMGGHHWIIERNTVRHVNSVGIEMGFRTFEARDRRATPRNDADLGYVIVRRNRVYDCGTAGIRGLGVSHGLVEDNEISDSGWQDAEFHWEVAGIKLLTNRGTLVRNNRLVRLQAGCGIWLDWDNQNSRVTGNVLYDVQTVQGAIFIEASPQANMVDNNILWKIDGQGVRAADTDNLIIAHNLFGRITEDLVYAKVATDRSIRGRKLTSTGNKVLNNIVVDAARPIVWSDPSNTADYNVYVSTRAGSAQVRDAGAHTVAVTGDVQFDERAMRLSWKPGQALNAAPPVAGCPEDFHGRARTAENNVAGPFLAFFNPATVELIETGGVPPRDKF
jgi:alpha-L-arabinofuranosidase